MTPVSARPGWFWRLQALVWGAHGAHRARVRCRFARLWANLKWFWPMGAWFGARLTTLFCALLVGESLAIIGGFLWLKHGDWSLWGSAAFHVALLLAGACSALQVVSRLWPTWYGAAATKLLVFSGVLLAGWFGAMSARQMIAAIFNAPVELFPAAAAASVFLTAQQLFSLPLMVFCLLLELLVLPSAFVKHQSDSKGARNRPRGLPMLAIVLSFVALFSVSSSSARLGNGSTQAILIGQIGWWGDLVEAPEHCATSGVSQRIALRPPERKATLLVRAAKDLPDKPAWVFDIRERARFGSFDVSVIHCDPVKANSDKLSRIEDYQERTERYWGIAPVVTIEFARSGAHHEDGASAPD